MQFLEAIMGELSPSPRSSGAFSGSHCSNARSPLGASTPDNASHLGRYSSPAGSSSAGVASPCGGPASYSGSPKRRQHRLSISSGLSRDESKHIASAPEATFPLKEAHKALHRGERGHNFLQRSPVWDELRLQGQALCDQQSCVAEAQRPLQCPPSYASRSGPRRMTVEAVDTEFTSSPPMLFFRLAISPPGSSIPTHHVMKCLGNFYELGDALREELQHVHDFRMPPMPEPRSEQDLRGFEFQAKLNSFLGALVHKPMLLGANSFRSFFQLNGDHRRYYDVAYLHDSIKGDTPSCRISNCPGPNGRPESLQSHVDANAGGAITSPVSHSGSFGTPCASPCATGALGVDTHSPAAPSSQSSISAGTRVSTNEPAIRPPGTCGTCFERAPVPLGAFLFSASASPQRDVQSAAVPSSSTFCADEPAAEPPPVSSGTVSPGFPIKLDCGAPRACSDVQYLNDKQRPSQKDLPRGDPWMDSRPGLMVSEDSKFLQSRNNTNTASSIFLEACLKNNEEIKQRLSDAQAQASKLMSSPRDGGGGNRLSVAGASQDSLGSCESLTDAIPDNEIIQACLKKNAEIKQRLDEAHVQVSKLMASPRVGGAEPITNESSCPVPHAFSPTPGSTGRGLPAQQASNAPQDGALGGATIKHLCVVCLERPQEVAVDPCGHLSMCRNCAAIVGACPVCRGRISKALRVYAS